MAVPLSGLTLHLVADNAVTDGAGVVTGWADQSGNLNDITAISGSPMKVAGALNGHAVIEFDGDYAERAQPLHNFSSGAADRSIFYLVRYNSGGYGGCSYGLNGTNNLFGLVVDNQNRPMIQGWGGGNDYGIPGVNLVTDYDWLVQGVTLASNVHRHWVDGTMMQQFTNTRNTNIANANSRFILAAEIDRSPLVRMEVAEVLVYNRALSDAEVAQVHDHFEATYFGVASGTAHQGEAALAGAGTLAAEASRSHSAAAALTGVGTVAATASRIHVAGAVLSGVGTLAGASTRTQYAATALAGTGALAAAAVSGSSAAAAFTGTGSLTAQTADDNTQAVAASFTGTGSMAATAQTGRLVGAAFSGAGSLAAVANSRRAGLAALAGFGTFAADAVSSGARSTGIFAYICTRTTADPYIPPATSDMRTFTRDVSDAFVALSGGYQRVGQLSFFPVQRSVPNHLLCDGKEVAKASFPELYSYLGDTQGFATNAANFMLPNFIGQALEPATVAAVETVNQGTVSTPVPPDQPPDWYGYYYYGDTDSGGRYRDHPHQV